MGQTRVFPEKVTAAFTRFKGTDGVYLVRNDVKICFGDAEADRQIGAVIATNPGSYGFKGPAWDDFCNGKGEADTYCGWAYPDLTMQNIIRAVREAHGRIGQTVPNGYVRMYNLTSVVCPDGRKAEQRHNGLKALIHVKDKPLLMDPAVHVESRFRQMCDDAPFVIMGFMQGVLEAEAKKVLKWSTQFPDKIVISADHKRWPSHPRRWRTEKHLMLQAVGRLARVLEHR